MPYAQFTNSDRLAGLNDSNVLGSPANYANAAARASWHMSKAYYAYAECSIKHSCGRGEKRGPKGRPNRKRPKKVEGKYFWPHTFGFFFV